MKRKIERGFVPSTLNHLAMYVQRANSNIIVAPRSTLPDFVEPNLSFVEVRSFFTYTHSFSSLFDQHFTHVRTVEMVP